MLNPAPQPEEIEQVREIAGLKSYSETETLINGLNNAQWARTLDDITEWEKVRNKHTRIKGDGIEIDKSDNRLDIRNRVRVRLGYPEVDEYGQTKESTTFFFPSCTVSKNVTW